MKFEILQGDVIDRLRGLQAESVHCCVTSPPYWGLRSYHGVPASVWGGMSDCVHQWDSGEWRDNRHTPGAGPKQASNEGSEGWRSNPRQCDFCSICGAWRGHLGLEPDPELFVQHLVEVFRHVRRVLRRSGTLWLNLGDCFITNPHGNGPRFDPKYPGGRIRNGDTRANRTNAPESIGLKSKDLAMIPARAALALQADGWYLRQQIPWLKRNGMVESTRDRPTSMIEWVFLLSPNEDYYYDVEATLVAQAEHERTRRLREQEQGLSTVYGIRRDDETHGQVRPGRNGVAKCVQARQELAMRGTRRRRNTDWFFESLSADFQGLIPDEDGGPLAFVVNPQPFSLEMCAGCERIYEIREYKKLELVCAACELPRTGDRCSCGSETWTRLCSCGSAKWLSHFATFPQKLVRPMILASSSEYGCCALCGEPYTRMLSRQRYGDWHPNGKRGHRQEEPNNSAKMATLMARRAKNGDPVNSIAKQAGAHDQVYIPPTTVGWEPSCSHPLFPGGEPVPCTILDPFGGSGRTAQAAMALGRNVILIEASAQYVKMAEHQLRKFAADFQPLEM